MELRFNISNDARFNQLKEQAQLPNGTDLCRQSLSMMEWGVQQAQAGRTIMAVDKSGNQSIWPIDNVIGSARW